MNGQRRALVVAIDRYVHPMLRKLAAPTADAAALARVLGEPDLGGFDVDVLTDADSYEVTQAVEALLSDSGPSDLVLLHFSCHGIKDDSGELFLAATNTVPNRLVSTAVDAGLVNRLMQRSRAQRVILLLDCCYGGAFERGVVARATGDVDVAAQFTQSSPGGGRGRVVITASSAMEYAFEGTTLTDSSGPTPSLFTGALVEGITSGEADRDQDGQVGLHELYDYIHDKVRARTPNQTPSKWEFGVQGDLYIARNPRRRILPGRLPDELLGMVAHPIASVRLAAVQDLDRLAGGHNLQLAAGARLALQELRGDDSRRVSAAATNALERTALRITPTRVDLGEVPIGSRPRAEVRVDGGPLALASSIEVTHQHLHARFDGSVLTITTTTGEPGRLDGQVRLSGPAGDAIVDITGAVVATRHAATQPAPTRSDQTDPTAVIPDQVTPEPPAPRAAQESEVAGLALWTERDTGTRRSGLSRDLIHQLVSELSLPGEGNSFLVIEREDGPEWYAQTARTAENDYVVEYRDGDTARHFAAPHLTMPEAQVALCGWAFNLLGWRNRFRWAQVALSDPAAAETGSTADLGPVRSSRGTWATSNRTAQDDTASVSTPPVKAPDPSTTDNRAPASTPTRTPQPEGPPARPAPQPAQDSPSPPPAAPAQTRIVRPHDTGVPTSLVPGHTATPSVIRRGKRLGIRHVLWALMPVLSFGVLVPVPFAHAAVRLHDRRLWLITSAYVTAWIPLFVTSIATDGVADFLYLTLAVIATAHALPLRRRVFAESSASPPPTEP